MSQSWVDRCMCPFFLRTSHRSNIFNAPWSNDFLSIQWRTGHNYRREDFSQCKLGNSMEMLPCSLTTLTPTPDRVGVPPLCSHMPWALLSPLSWPFDCKLLQELPVHRCLVKVCWRKERKKGEGKWIWNFPTSPPSLSPCLLYFSL